MKKPKIKSFILLAVLSISASFLYAIPAIPYPVLFTQPDGNNVTVMIKGDERIHWHETMDGYTLLFNSSGYLSYAQLDVYGNLQPTDFVATDIEEREMATAFFLNSIDKGLFYSDVQQQLMLQVWEIEDEIAAQFESRGDRAVIGEYKTLCAFVQFPEKSFVKSMSDFEGLMNQLGYTGNGTGSVRDFFKESSYNQFDLTITLCGIYTAPQSEAYYAGSSGTQNCGSLARWAAQQVAAEQGIDFSEFDSTGNGQVDGFHFIFAVRGQEAGGGNGTIWSHKSSLSTQNQVCKNGTCIRIYSCSPELYNSNITTIGVICHEMTHAFGAPDFYDTNGATGGSFTGTGNWDLMAGGSWNGSPGGNRPALHNMFTKIQFGWVTPVILNAKTTVTDMPNAAENPVAYRINTTTNNEYYLLENRQKVKFDSSVPGSGLLIYHVHSGVNNAQNCINCTHPQRMYPVCASRTTQMPNSTPASYGTINSSGTPFPNGNKTSFTNATTPAMKSWANANTNKPIINITQSNGLISFYFMPDNIYTITASSGANGAVSPVGVTEIMGGGSKSYTITPSGHYERETVLINGVNNTDAVNSGTYNFQNVTSNQTIHATFAPKIYTVTFNANGGTGSMETQNFSYGVAENLTANSFNKTDYEFKSWNTQMNGNGTTYTDEQKMYPTANITLYAQWKIAGPQGIDETAMHDSSIQIIPNPANDYIDLRFTIYELRFEHVDFYNVWGQLVKSVPVSAEIQDNIITQRVSITDLSRGLYLIKIGTKTAKLLVH